MKNNKNQQQTANTKEGIASDATSDGTKDADLRSRMQLTDRDRQLMGLLSWVRHLTEDQIGRLIYSGRSPINLRKRILLLSGFSKKSFRSPYLRRLQYRTLEGALVPVWVLRAGLPDRGDGVGEGPQSPARRHKPGLSSP